MPASKLNDPGARIGRMEAMQMMAERRREKVADDMTPEDHAALTTETTEEETTAPPTDPHSADARPQERSVYAIAAELEKDSSAAQEAAPVLTPAPAPELDLTRRVKLKVNGQEIERSLAEVIADAQKVSAADEYLQRSRDQLHSINQLADEVRAKLKSDSPPAPEASADTTQDDPASEGVAALFRGDEETAKAAFRKLAQGSRGELDTSRVASLVRQQMTLDEARAGFLQAHPDADSDPIATGAANAILRVELAKVGAPSVEALQPEHIRPVFEAAARALTAWRTGKTSPQATPAARPDVARASRKATIDELPAASARAATQEPTPQTNSSVIAQMRAQRPGSAIH